MSLALLANNFMDSATSIATSTTAAGYPKERLYDRHRSMPCKANAAADFDVDIVIAAALAPTALGLINHNVSANIEVYGDTASAIGTTLKATLTPAFTDPHLATLSVSAETKWRIRFKNSGTAVSIGELLLGIRRLVSTPPHVDSQAEVVVGNVTRDRSVGGVPRATRLGVSRISFAPRWTILPDADLAIVRLAFADAQEGLKNLLVADSELATVRWMSWLNDRVAHVPLGLGQSELALLFEEAL